jgi:putative Mn2+ efflux pump MntP
MSNNESEFIKALKRWIATALLTFFGTMVIGAFTFYNVTGKEITEAQVRMQGIEARQRVTEAMQVRLDHEKINKSDYIREVDEMKMLLRELNNKIDKIHYGE